MGHGLVLLGNRLLADPRSPRQDGRASVLRASLDAPRRLVVARREHSSTENYERWSRNGGKDAAARASEVWKKTLEEYEQPPMDEALRAQLEEYVNRRRAELGD